MTWQSWQIERTQILKAQHESGQSAPCEMYLFKLNSDFNLQKVNSWVHQGRSWEVSPAIPRMCSTILFDFPTAEWWPFFVSYSCAKQHLFPPTKITSQFSLTYFYSFESVKDVCRQKTSLGQRDPLQREIFLWIVLYRKARSAKDEMFTFSHFN